MYCSNCGQYNDDSLKFCTNCGSPLGSHTSFKNDNTYNNEQLNNSSNSRLSNYTDNCSEVNDLDLFGVDMCILAVVFWIIWFIQALKGLFKHYIVIAILAVVLGDIIASLIGSAIGTSLVDRLAKTIIYNYFN